MTAKTQARDVPAGTTAATAATEAPEHLHAAYQAHTLAQILYGQLAAFQPSAPWHTPPVGFHPVPHSDPFFATAHPTVPWSLATPPVPTWAAYPGWPQSFPATTPAPWDVPPGWPQAFWGFERFPR